MGKVLQCPRCQRTHPLDRHTGVASFACAGCGRPLKVPEQYRSAAGSAPPARPAPAPRAMPAPERRRDATSVLPASPAPRAPAAPAPAAARPKPRLVWRIGAWILAVLLGGAIVLVGGRMLGYLSGQRALEVVISSGLRRYTVLLPLVPVWAVITTLLVTLFLDGLPAWARRRRARRERASAGDDAAAAPDPSPPPRVLVPDDTPPPRRVSEGRRAGGRRAGGHPG